MIDIKTLIEGEKEIEVIKYLENVLPNRNFTVRKHEADDIKNLESILFNGYILKNDLIIRLNVQVLAGSVVPGYIRKDKVIEKPKIITKNYDQLLVVLVRENLEGKIEESSVYSKGNNSRLHLMKLSKVV